MAKSDTFVPLGRSQASQIAALRALERLQEFTQTAFGLFLVPVVKTNKSLLFPHSSWRRDVLENADTCATNQAQQRRRNE